MADFLDKVLVGINKGVNAVSENSKLVVEKARLNTQIKEIEDKKLKLAQQLGILAYNMQTKGELSIEQFQPTCDNITQCNNEVNNLKMEVQKLEQTRSVVATETSLPITDGVRCSCGFMNKQGSKFCAKCGSKIGE